MNWFHTKNYWYLFCYPHKHYYAFFKVVCLAIRCTAQIFISLLYPSQCFYLMTGLLIHESCYKRTSLQYHNVCSQPMSLDSFVVILDSLIAVGPSNLLYFYIFHRLPSHLSAAARLLYVYNNCSSMLVHITIQ